MCLIIYLFITAGVRWVPELLDHHTEEWQRLAKDVKEEVSLNNIVLLLLPKYDITN